MQREVIVLADREFMGVGMSFPPEVDKTSGRFKTSSYEDKIRESILLILKTQKGERITLPQFGGSINSYVFSGTDTATLNLMANSIKRALTKNEMRIKDINIQIFKDRDRKEKLYIDIGYVVSETDTPGNLVFPFYLEGSGEREYEID